MPPAAALAPWVAPAIMGGTALGGMYMQNRASKERRELYNRDVRPIAALDVKEREAYLAAKQKINGILQGIFDNPSGLGAGAFAPTAMAFQGNKNISPQLMKYLQNNTTSSRAAAPNVQRAAALRQMQSLWQGGAQQSNSGALGMQMAAQDIAGANQLMHSGLQGLGSWFANKQNNDMLAKLIEQAAQGG